MKNFLKYFGYWCVPGLLLLPIGGCFTHMSHFMGARPGMGEAIVVGTLDVVTMPVQIVVFGPMIVKECIRENTGERGRKKREAERRRKEVERYKEMLSSDFSQVYRNDEFFSITNTPARDALHDWLCAYGIHHPSTEEIDPFVERLIAAPEAAVALTPVFHQRNLSAELKRKLCVTLVEFSRAKNADERRGIMYWADEILSDDELRGLVLESQDETDCAIKDILRKREERRERARKEDDARAARRQEEEERQKRRAEEARRRHQRISELQVLARDIDAEYGRFVKTLSLRGELTVADSWARRLCNASEPLPSENVRKLAEVLTEPVEPWNTCCETLFGRPELTEEDLRGLYPRILKKMEERGIWRELGWRCAGVLIKNPNFPPDLARASYNEPVLSQLRIVYVIHHVGSLDASRRYELQGLDRKCDDLKRDFLKGKLAFDKFNAIRFELTKRFLPDDCPDDWIKSMP